MVNKIVVEDHTFGMLTWVKLSEILEMIYNEACRGDILQEDVEILLLQEDGNGKAHENEPFREVKEDELFISIFEDGSVVGKDCESTYDRHTNLWEVG